MERSAKRPQGDQARSVEWDAKRRHTGGNDGTAGGASSTHTSTEGQEVVTSSGYDYEVFLSFRGPDTRAAFTDFLYTSLNDAGICTFKDDEDLRKGEEFPLELLQAIKQSKILVPIFSKGYASSVWCLKELVQMVECKKTQRQKIMPIFYDVAPSEVRYQTGGYKEAFRSHKEKQRYDEKTMQDWKNALNAVGAIHGWDLHSMSNRREGEFVKDLAKKIFRELEKAYLVVSNCLVNVDKHVDAIMELIGAQTSETRIIGIYGMGGIGKTTTAKIIYNQLSKNFEGCCFLSNIREMSKHKGIEGLQNQLISDILENICPDIRNIDHGIKIIKDRLSNKRILLLLDDVHEKNHMDALVGERDWFGRGSKLLITTRNKKVLDVLKVDDDYELTGMDRNQSLQLFSKHAFRRDSPLDEYIDQSNKVIDIVKGLPLAIEVIGSLLSHTEKREWNDILEKLENVPHTEVQSRLKISYDTLEVRHKHIFLDIACLFIGYDKDVMVHFWEKSDFFPEEALKVLQNMSLIKIEENNRVWMHDQLRDLGREIVRQESKTKLKKQSRVWDPKKGLDLLRNYKGEKKVEALRLNLDNHQQYRFSYEGFENISNLRFLEVDGSMENFRAEDRLLWHESPSNLLPIDDFQENSNLLPQLRWLSWPNIPPTFKITNFSMKDVVFLDLSRSEITHNWKGWSHMKVMKNLKVMDLSNCYHLERTPNFSAHPKLERLILNFCGSLVKIDKSICKLKRLVFLDLRFCWDLRRLPNTIGDLKLLKELDIRNTKIKKLPDSIGELKLLNKLNIFRMGIEELPHSIGNLESLIELDISCSKIKELPDSIGELKNLKVVKMNGCSTSNIPDALWRIGKLEVIEATAHHVNVKIGNAIYGNQALRILELNKARMNKVPRLPKGLTILKLSYLYMNTFPDLSNLTNLEKLELEFARCDSNGESDGPVEEDPMPLRIGNVSKLESLDLRSPYVTALPTDIGSLLPQLKSLTLWCPNLSKLESPYVTALPDISLLSRLEHLSLKCPNLDCLPSLPSSLSSLKLESECRAALPTGMRSLLTRLHSLSLELPNLPCLPSFPSGLSYLWLESKCVTTLPPDMSALLPRLGSLKLRCCPDLPYLPSLPSSLGFLRLEDCKSCRSMGDLSNLKTLRYLKIFECAISEIQGLDRLENLGTLELGKLQRVEILPDLRNLNKLLHLKVSDCGNLVEIQGEFPSSLRALDILDCGSLQKLPDLSSLERQKICLERCEKLDVAAIYSLYPEEEDVKSEGDDDEFGCEFDDESEGEDDESGCESEYGSEGED